MVLSMARPSTCNGRPAYLDNLYRDSPPPVPQTPSLRSASSSISFNSTTSPVELRAVQPTPRALSPAFEEDRSDTLSIRSLKVKLNPRKKIRGLLNRRTYPQVQETVDVEFPTHRPTPSVSNLSLSNLSSRRPSLPKLQTALSSPTRKTHAHSAKPLPATPAPMAEELKCQPCYYFTARNCKGYVMGGSHGDACDGCAQAGFFGAI